ncbi:unnamed protein product [Adineta ricciae]|uniref:Uncharacterized protein n=1 Tax=Adineta ricciae TaxID=249248 RepID=A0A815TVV4_ADIRI|nr:unnamed protein product [Adineta ricciae]CAF1517491.1 unnamed protein product [Adineta ricciae]
MNNWSSGLFDCRNDGDICLRGCLGPSFLFGANAELIDGSDRCRSCLLYFLITRFYLCCLPHIPKRKALRERFDIAEDNDCNDCLATTFCRRCAVCQEARELKFRLASSERTVVVQPVSANTYGSVEKS